MPKATMHRVECLDCKKVRFQIIKTDIPVVCRECGSDGVMWYPA